MSTEPARSSIVPSIVPPGWNREHWYFLGLVVLLEYIYLHFIYTYGQDLNVINYWSFAGTITSIILAVIAIIYGFVQTMTQQSSAERLTNQLDSLGKVIEKFKAPVETLSQVSSTLSAIAEGVVNSRSELAAIRKDVEAALKAPATVPIARVQGVVGSPEQFIQMLSTAAYGVAVLMYSIWRLGARRLTSEVIIRKFILPTLDPPPEGSDDTDVELYSLLWDGVAIGIVNILDGMAMLATHDKEHPRFRLDLEEAAARYFAEPDRMTMTYGDKTLQPLKTMIDNTPSA